MGNMTSLESNTNNSYKIKLATFACIRVSEITSTTNEFGEAIEKQSVRYEVNDRACNLTLTKTKPPGNNKRGQKFIISISEVSTSVRIEVQIVEGGHVVVTCARASADAGWINTFTGKTKVFDLTSRNNLKTKSTADGGIIESCILYNDGPYFRSNAKALIVIQLNKKARDQIAYMVTVAHYFIHLGRTDTGLSLVAQIHGQEGLKLEGPIQHPGTALYQVMEQSKRSGRWTPKACPHCANGYDQQRGSSQPKKKDQKQSESNSEEDSNRAAAATFARHSEAVLSNNGVTIGNGNGSMCFSSEKMEVYLGGKRI